MAWCLVKCRMLPWPGTWLSTGTTLPYLTYLVLRKEKSEFRDYILLPCTVSVSSRQFLSYIWSAAFLNLNRHLLYACQEWSRITGRKPQNALWNANRRWVTWHDNINKWASVTWALHQAGTTDPVVCTAPTQVKSNSFASLSLTEANRGTKISARFAEVKNSWSYSSTPNMSSWRAT